MELIVVRCGSCGHTFPTESGDEARCPTCGSDDLDVAAEPLL